MSSILEANKYFFWDLSDRSSKFLKVIISPKTLAVSDKVKGVLESSIPCLADKYWWQPCPNS